MRLPVGKVGRLLILVASIVGVTGCAKTAFEKEHERAESRNPNWLSIELDTYDKRHRYRESETINVITHYSSVVPYQYKVQRNNENDIIASDLLHISTGEKKLLGGMVGFVCCFSDVVGLTEEPIQVGRSSALKLKAGKYELYVTTQRVFPWKADSVQYSPSEWTCASNLLTIRVVPDGK